MGLNSIDQSAKLKIAKSIRHHENIVATNSAWLDVTKYIILGLCICVLFISAFTLGVAEKTFMNREAFEITLSLPELIIALCEGSLPLEVITYTIFLSLTLSCLYIVMFPPMLFSLITRRFICSESWSIFWSFSFGISLFLLYGFAERTLLRYLIPFPISTTFGATTLQLYNSAILLSEALLFVLIWQITKKHLVAKMLVRNWDSLASNSLMYALVMSEYFGILNDTVAKRAICRDLERTAKYIGTYMPRYYADSDFETSKSLESDAIQIATAIRSIKNTVRLPGLNSENEFKNKIAKMIIDLSSGNWENLERLEAKEIPPPTRNQRIFSVINTIIISALPMALLYPVKQIFTDFDPEYFDYLLISSFIWAALSLLLRFDSTFREKLSALKDIEPVIPFFGKDKK